MADEIDDDGQGSGRTAKKGYTAPKGRPTRARDEVADRRRAFGPVAQWITLAAAIVVIVVIAILVTNGGDFNPNDDLFGSGTAPAEFPPAGNPAISDL